MPRRSAQGCRLPHRVAADDCRERRRAHHLYTLKISNPSATDQQEVLSSAWVNIGTVSAGSQSSGAKTEAAPWLRVPPLSIEARRSYDDKTKIHQEVMGEIEALNRAQTRSRRMLAGLDQRIAAAEPATADGLKQERTRIAVQVETQGAELDARNAEYQDLPRTPWNSCRSRSKSR